MNRPLLVVGDVQGDADRLVEALEPFAEDAVDTVFLGDFFQGGRPGDAGGYRAATIARDRRNSRSILGNHDLFLLCVLEEERGGPVPDFVRAGGAASVSEIWLRRRGDWADLRALDGDPDLERWLRGLPLMLRLPDGTLIQHCDDDAYANLGPTVEAVNAAAHERLAASGGCWGLLRYTVGRRAFDDVGRVESHLRRFDARRVVHGHTPHWQEQPVVAHGGRVWSFDGCFSRYWSPDGAGCGPVGATVALLPPLVGTGAAGPSH